MDEPRVLRWIAPTAAVVVAAVLAAVAWVFPSPREFAPLAVDAVPGWGAIAATVGEGGAVVLSIGLAAVAAAALIRLVVSSGNHPVADAVGGVAGAALLTSGVAWMIPATGPTAVTALGALALLALAALDRLAHRGDPASGVVAAATIGWLVGARPAAATLLVPLGLLVAVRLRHGARWPLLLPSIVALAWAMAASHASLRIVAGASGGAATPPADASAYGHAVFDHLGPLGVIAAALGAWVLLGRGRRSRHTALAVAALLVAGLLDDGAAQVGPLGSVAAAVAAGVAVARAAQPIGLTVGRVAFGVVAVVLLATPPAYFAAEALAAR